MTKQQIQAIIDALINMRDNATDEVALVSSALYPAWKEGTAYTSGQRILYNGVLYRVLSNHTSQADWTPDVAASLFAKVLTSDSGEILPWEQPDSTNPYMKGDKVVYNGKTYASTIDNNVWAPDVYGWEEI